MRVMPQRGMPPRESFQDRVAQEMLLRERRCAIATNTYIAQCVTAGYALHPAIFAQWTLHYRDEVSHANYRPEIVRIKRRQLDEFEKRRRLEGKHVSRVDSYTVTKAADMLPYSPAELELIKQKLRARTLQRAMKKPE